MQKIFQINNRWWIFSLFPLLMAVGCGQEEEKKTDERATYIIPDSIMKIMKIDTVKLANVEDVITLTGMVDFNQDNQVNIFPPVSGIVQNANAQLGDYVQQGQVLATVKSSEMAGYENNLVTAETNLDNAKKQLQAAKDLFKSGLNSQLDVSNAQVNYDQAVAQLVMVQRILKINGNNKDGIYVMKSPISGFIVQKNITNNTIIRADNGTNLFTISDLKNVWIQANVYESNISKVHVGDAVNVTTLSYPDKVFKGKVDKILNVLDPTSKVMKVRVTLPNDSYLLKPQMFASVNVSNNLNKQSLAVSSPALVYDHSQYYILLYNSNKDVRIMPVQVSGSNGDLTYVSGDIKAGDKVIAYDALQIYSALNS
jgi:cobalt-zinc-cadmium efflux system membrane fusion protein